MGMSPAPYTGPVPLVTHLHGGHTFDDSDGYPEAWYLPAAGNIPPGYATEGTWYQLLQEEGGGAAAGAWAPRHARPSSTRTTSRRRRSGPTITRSA